MELATFIECQVGTLHRASYGCCGDQFRRRRQTSFTIVVIPPLAIRRGILNATSVVAAFRCVAHVADHTSTYVQHALTAKFFIATHNMEQRVFDAMCSPTLELDAKYLRWYGEVADLIRQLRAVAVRIGATEREVFIRKELRLKMRIQGFLNCHVQVLVMYQREIEPVEPFRL